MEDFTILDYLLPWELSLGWLLASAAAVSLYLRGLRVYRRRGEAVGVWRALAFLIGVLGIYAVTQTHYDYLAQYMFFTHRAQHLVLHHVAPFLIALAAPWPVLAAGFPAGARRLTRLPSAAAVLWRVYRLLQHPVVAPLLFVGLIYFWLIPEVHFDAMLSRDLYQVMNWSMAVYGLLFWWLMLNPQPKGRGGLGYGARIAMLVAISPPQIFLGAYITFSKNVIFDVYEVCGRAWPLAPLEDQQLGGLLTWIPAAMMSGLGGLVVLSYVLFNEGGNARASTDTTNGTRTARVA